MAVIFGTSGNDTLNGTGVDDFIFGNDGDDTLNGGGGDDVMSGGAGNDSFFVNTAQDQVIESVGGGFDVVHASVSFALPDNVEGLALQGTANINGTGNALGNFMLGNSGNNILAGSDGNDLIDGFLGNDRVKGDSGNDTLRGDDGHDTLDGGTGNDLLEGGDGNDSLVGGKGHDTLDGGFGTDTLDGGSGDDTYVFGSGADFVVEAAGGGRDTILTSANVLLAPSGAEIEVVQITSTRGRQVIGNTSTETLIGNTGDDDLRQFSGDATLIGGGGNDVYHADASDTIIEDVNAGIDLVEFILNAVTGNAFTLGANLENLNATGSQSAILTGNELGNTIASLNGNDTLSGLGGSDVLNGGGGNDVLDGGTGIDAMSGGAGNDVFFVDDQADQILETAGQGADVVNASTSYALASGQEIERVQLLGGDNINATGNELANTLIGNSGNNALSSGAGNDQMVGDAGNDAFVYRLGDGVDLISDFTGAGVTLGDFIVLDDTGIADFNSLLPLISDVAGGCQIQFNANDFLVLANVSKSQLDASDFSFS